MAIDFFLIIVDDFSKMTWVFLIKCKFEAIDILEYFSSHIFTQFSKNIKILKSDNAPELYEGEMKVFYTQKRILQ